MTTIAWFHCFAGVAGDMALGALVDAGAHAAEVEARVRALDLGDWELHVGRVQRAGLAATRAEVRVHDQGGHGHRPAREVLDRIGSCAALGERARDRAIAVYRRLAEVEGALHGVDPDEVELHEVGAVDSIVDVVGTCVALDLLDVGEVRCSPIALGAGTVRSAHGVLPDPAPATVRLLASVGAPVLGVDAGFELTTPTGAALMAVLAGPGGFGPLPPMTLGATGFGAGGRDAHGRPNVTQVVLGTALGTAAVGRPGSGQPVVTVEATVDDVTGEVLAHALGAALAAGAHDAWIVPVTMKKGRPGHVLTALCDPGVVERVSAVVLAETGSLGVRAHTGERWPSARSTVTVEVGGHPVRVKIGPHRVKAEYDDAAAAAAASGRPVQAVAAEAEALGRAGETP